MICSHIMVSSSAATLRVSVNVPSSPKKANPKIPVFDVKLFLDSAGLGRKVAKFRGKETVLTQGDPAKNILYIQEGGAKLTVVNKAGKEAVVAILGPGDFLGEGCLAGQSNYLVTATTISPTSVLVI
ncbi:MAG: cyclic nucleotide-binding domain-containing protein, partial [Candidatus Acidiferrum sp.]